MKQTSQLLITAALVVGLIGCSSAPVRIGMQAGQTLNPDSSNRSLATMVRVYQLTDTKAFDNASFEQLYRNDKGVLADSLLDKSEKMISPGSQTDIKLVRNKNAKFFGAVALFRSHKGKGWKVTAPLGKPLPVIGNRVQVSLTRDQIRLVG